MNKWSTNKIEKFIELAKAGILHGSYGINETNYLRNALKKAHGIKNGRVLVIGSEIPWVEACVLEAGAKHVVTLEYGRIDCTHPNVTTIIPMEYRDMFNNGTLGKFDSIVTFSSVEHSGLGRYGDSLNPWGDVEEIARAWCVCKEGGSLTIGVPFAKRDKIRFNADRRYGPIRWPYLTTNWRQKYREPGGINRVHVFVK